MKNYIIRIVKMTAYYSFLGLILQGVLVNLLFAITPAEGQNLKDVKVKANVVNISLEEALQVLEQKTNFKFNYIKEEIPLSEKVTVIVEDESLYNILEVFAKDYGLTFNRINDQIVVKKNQGQTENLVTSEENGTLKGIVREARTNQPIPGANILVSGLNIGASAGLDGNYTIMNVPPGKYNLIVSAVGYGKTSKSVVVTDGKETIINFMMNESAIGLDEVVVTGVAFQTNKKTIPSAITVITAKEIEAKKPNNLLDLLDGEVPGVNVKSVGVRDYGTIVSRNNAKLDTSSPDAMKVYVDGVEVADPLYVRTLSNDMIDRIEIVSGGAASTIYGSGSVGGVIQIFTKKGIPGRNTPKVDIKSSVGYIQSQWKPEGIIPLQQDLSLSVNGGGSEFSYRVGGTLNTIGEWVNNYSSKSYSLNGGMRVSVGPFTTELTGMYSERPYTTASAASYLYYQWPKSASLPYGGQKDLIYPNVKYNYKQTLFGINSSYQITPDWIANLTIGIDDNSWMSYQIAPYKLTASDTLLQMQGWGNKKRSIRFNSAYSLKFSDEISARFTLGVDWWGNSYESKYASNMRRVVGSVSGTAGSFYSLGNDYIWNLGYFGIAEIGFFDKFFLTLANRFEESPRYGANIKRVSAPRIGLSYSTNLSSDISLKLRGQWGEGTRLPDGAIYSQGIVRSFGPNTNIVLPNPSLKPEKKSGWDAGVELYLGNYASFSVTRFSEDGKDLIMSNYLQVGPPTSISQYQNVGDVETRGWELAATLNWEWLSLKMNYTYSKGTVINLGNDYQRSTNSLYHEGDQILFFPTNSGGGTITVKYLQGSASLNASYTANLRSYDGLRRYETLYGGVPPLGNNTLRDYLILLPTIWMVHLQTEQQLNNWLNVFVQVRNILNDQETDVNRGEDIGMGRTWILGVHLTF